MIMFIDADTGVDDSIALLYAMNHPAVKISGITTGCGNVDALQAARNTLNIIKLVGLEGEIPVVVGANKPLCGEWGGKVAHIHGDNGVGNVVLPESDVAPRTDLSAEDFMYQMACRYEGELVLVTLGRLTNIAKCLTKYPDFKDKVARVITMGGCLNCSGNVSPVAEANVEGDPEACDQVFLSGMNITVVGLDVTTRVKLNMKHVDLALDYCADSSKPALTYMKQALIHYMAGCRKTDGWLDECPLHDPLAMMVAVSPDLVMTKAMKARVECGGTYCRGQIVTDQRTSPVDAEYINFALEVDADRAISELFSVFKL